MATIISCTNKFDDVYNYNIKHNLEFENGFEVNVLVRVKETYREARINYNENDYPSEHDFDIDYDSFDIQFYNHSEIEQQTINEWIEKVKESGTFEDAFWNDYFEV